MFNSADQTIIGLLHQGLRMLPYANTCIGSYAIGEIAWFIVIAECMGQIFIMRYKKVGK